MFDIFINDRKLLERSPYGYRMQPRLKDFPDRLAPALEGEIILKDPCDSPFYLGNEGEVNDIETDLGGTASFQFPSVKVLPDVCLEEATYTCEFLSGPYTGDMDPCAMTSENGDYGTTSEFDPETGEFLFDSNDKEEFPEGEYEFKAKALIGDKETSTVFKMQVTNPCPTTEVELLESPFEELYEYTREDESLEIAFSLSEIGTKAARVDCGTPSITFLTMDDEPLDEEVFTVETDKLIVHTKSMLKGGEYKIKYRYFFAEYPENFAESDSSFSIVVIDPCRPPEGYEHVQPTLIAPPMDD